MSRPSHFPTGLQSIESALATRHAYTKGKMAYVSFNGMHLLALEPKSNGTPRDPQYNPLRASESSNDHPYAAFVLRAPSRDDRHMQRLLIATNNIPHVRKVDEQGRQTFTFEIGTMKRWRKLEEILRRMGDSALKVIAITNIAEPQSPSSFRYYDTFDSYERLRRHVLAARRAFDLYIAWVVYVTAVCSDVGHIQRTYNKSAISWPKWCLDVVKDEDEIKADWLHNFLFSQAFDFNSERVGVFISPHTCSFLHEITSFLCARIPFTVMWALGIDNDGIWFPPRLSNEVKFALRHTSDVWGPDMDWSQATRNAGAVSNSFRSNTAIPPNVYHWLDFFSEREVATSLTFVKRLNDSEYLRRRYNATVLTKYKKGTSVYLWEPFSGNPPLWRRRKIEGELKNDKWDEHEPHERVYCEFRDEWDLCKPMTEGMPPPPERTFRPPCELDSESIVKPVPDQALRPYLIHPLWLKRHPVHVQPKHVQRTPDHEYPSHPLQPMSTSLPRHHSPLPARPHLVSSRVGPLRHNDSYLLSSSRMGDSPPQPGHSLQHGQRPSYLNIYHSQRQPLFDSGHPPRKKTCLSSPQPECMSHVESHPTPTAPSPTTGPTLETPPPTLAARKRKRAISDADSDGVVSLDENFSDEDSLDEDYCKDPECSQLRAIEGGEMSAVIPSQNAPFGAVMPEPPSMTTTTDAIQFEPFLEYMYFRYSFTYPPQGLAYASFGGWKGSLSDAGLHMLRGKLLDQETALGTPDELRRHLFHFVVSLSTNGSPPSSLWDLSPQNDSRLVRSDAKVKVEIVDAVEFEGKLGTLYRLHAGQERSNWTLYVRDAMVAIECLRRGFVTTRDIVVFFLRRGTPFTMGFESVGLNAHPRTIRLASARTADFAPTPEIFIEWENATRAFMRTSRSRLVWKLGGLYWRLALYLLGSTASSLNLLDAPPDSANHKVTPMMYEETLTDEEMDLIMGKYDQPSRASPFLDFTSELSDFGMKQIRVWEIQIQRLRHSGLTPKSREAPSWMLAVGLRQAKDGSVIV